jgi:hypothetical protein
MIKDEVFTAIREGADRYALIQKTLADKSPTAIFAALRQLQQEGKIEKYNEDKVIKRTKIKYKVKEV